MVLKGSWAVLKLLEVAAIVGRQSHSSFDREFLHQVHGLRALYGSVDDCGSGLQGFGMGSEERGVE